MKKFEYLALKSYEFLDMLEAIVRERTTLRVKKKEEERMVLICQVAIPMAKIKYKTEPHEENLYVYRSVNWFPLVYSTIPILLFLEAIVFLITFFNRDTSQPYSIFSGYQWLSYLLVALAWLLGIAFVIYQIFLDLDILTQKLFKVKV